MEVQKTNNMPSMAKKKKNQRKRALKRALFWIKIILLAAVLVFLFYYLASSSIFNVKNVTLKGGNHYKDKELVQTAGIIIGVNGFKGVGGSVGNFLQLRYSKYEESIIAKCPYIKKVKVYFKLPSTVSINVEERRPILLIAQQKNFIILSEEGVMLEMVNNRKNYKLPLLKGIVLKQFIAGQAVSKQNINKMEQCLKVIYSINSNDKLVKKIDKLNSMLNYIDISLEDNVILNLDNRINVNLGELDELDYKIRAATEIVSNKLKKTDVGTLDFTSGENPVFIPR